MSSSRVYGIWRGMVERCERQKSISYKNYGAKGITVCERWRSSFLNFLQDMGFPPSDDHSIDRIDPEGNYEPGNCRWADSFQQSGENRHANRVSYNGRTMCLAAWGRELGTTGQAIGNRLRRGWPVARALSTPPRSGKHEHRL